MKKKEGWQEADQILGEKLRLKRRQTQMSENDALCPFDKKIDFGGLWHVSIG